MGGRPGTGLRPGDRRLRRSRPARPRHPAGLGRPVGVAGAGRPALHQRRDPRRGGDGAGLGHGRPSRRTGAVADRRPGRPRRAAGRRRRRGGRRRPARAWWSGRPGPARPPRWNGPSTTWPAGTGRCSGSRPTAKAARVLERETGMAADTVAKLLHEWNRTDRAPLDAVPAAGRHDAHRRRGRHDRHRLPPPPRRPRRAARAGGSRWSVIPASSKPSGRGGLFAELCATGRVHELARIHRFTEPWEAAASLQLRAGNPSALDAYEAHGRIVAGTVRRPPRPSRRRLDRPHRRRPDGGHHGRHQRPRRRHQRRHPSGPPQGRPPRPPTAPRRIGGGEHAHPGDVVATRRNDRHLRTATGRAGPQPRPVGRRRHPPRRVAHRVPPRRTRHRHPPRRLRPRARPARLRRHRARQPGRHRRRRHRARLDRHHPPRPLRRRHPRPRRQPHPRHHRRRTTSAKPATSSKRCWPTTGPTSPPSPSDATSPAKPAPARPRRPEPASIIPDWVGPWRAQLEQRRDESRRLPRRPSRPPRRGRRRTRRPPASTRRRPGRVAALPHAPSPRSRTSSRSELRPAMWQANHDAMHAGFGHHHATARRAKAANGRVDDAEARIAAIHADGADIKQRLDALEAQAWNLADLAHPSPGGVRPRRPEPRTGPPDRPTPQRRRRLDDVGGRPVGWHR